MKRRMISNLQEAVEIPKKLMMEVHKYYEIYQTDPWHQLVQDEAA